MIIKKFFLAYYEDVVSKLTDIHEMMVLPFGVTGVAALLILSLLSYVYIMFVFLTLLDTYEETCHWYVRTFTSTSFRDLESIICFVAVYLLWPLLLLIVIFFLFYMHVFFIHSCIPFFWSDVLNPFGIFGLFDEAYVRFQVCAYFIAEVYGLPFIIPFGILTYHWLFITVWPVLYFIMGKLIYTFYPYYEKHPNDFMFAVKALWAIVALYISVWSFLIYTLLLYFSLPYWPYPGSNLYETFSLLSFKMSVCYDVMGPVFFVLVIWFWIVWVNLLVGYLWERFDLASIRAYCCVMDFIYVFDINLWFFLFVDHDEDSKKFFVFVAATVWSFLVFSIIFWSFYLLISILYFFFVGL